MSAPVQSERVRYEAMSSAIIAGAADLAAAMARWLALVAEFDRREAWSEWECSGMVQWLSWKCGIAPSTARQHLFVARALEGLPAVAAAFERGELTYCKVRALVRFATPDTEIDLVELARVATGKQLAQIARAHHRATGDPERSRPRKVTVDWDDDGDMIIRAKVPADVGLGFLRALKVAAKVLTATDAGVDDTDDAAAASPAPSGSRPVDHSQRDLVRTVGMVAVFESLVQLALAGAGGAAASPPPPELVVMVTPDELGRSRERCDEPLTGRRGLTRDMVRRLGCDATTSTLLHDGRGSPLDLGRRRRVASPAQHTALHVRSGGTCEFPGCGHRRFLHAHHIEHWADGGHTDLANLILLCSFHHRLLHEGRYSTRITAGGMPEFLRPDGSSMPTGAVAPEPSDRGALPGASGTVEPSWGGERLDLGLTIDGILSLERVAVRRRQRDAAASSVPSVAA
jgi:hypothetical protein